MSIGVFPSASELALSGQVLHGQLHAINHRKPVWIVRLPNSRRSMVNEGQIAS
jgi:hypothetical protein